MTSSVQQLSRDFWVNSALANWYVFMSYPLSQANDDQGLAIDSCKSHNMMIELSAVDLDLDIE